LNHHNALILDQFTKQALPFAAAPAINNEATLKLLLDCTKADQSDTVLDVACGPGLVVCAFASVVNQATGIDLTPAMIETARGLQAKKNLTNVTWQTGDVERLPYADESFSIVASRYAFHHFLAPEKVLAEMKRVCKVGGKVLLIDVMVSPDLQKAALFNQMEKLRDPSHVRALTLVEMRELFRRVALPTPLETFYQLESELEKALQVSFPNEGDAEKVREMITNSIENDAMGTNTYRDKEKIKYFYPIAILLAEKAKER
jgi:ubiquinone/menaquinone biosynthesis C-methylase UbiE